MFIDTDPESHVMPEDLFEKLKEYMPPSTSPGAHVRAKLRKDCEFEFWVPENYQLEGRLLCYIHENRPQFKESHGFNMTRDPKITHYKSGGWAEFWTTIWIRKLESLEVMVDGRYEVIYQRQMPKKYD